MEAFRSRGGSDYRLSLDLTDIIIVVDGREELGAEAAGAPTDVRDFIAAEFSRLPDNPEFLNALPALLPGDAASQARAPLILQRMEYIARLGSDQ